MIPDGHDKFCGICGADTDVTGYTVSYRIDKETGNQTDVQVFCQPCDHAKSMGKYAETSVLRSRLTLQASLYKHSVEWSARSGKNQVKDQDRVWAKLYDKMNQSMEKVQDLIELFEQKVWFAGLQEQVEATNSRGLSADFGESKMLVWSCAGRTLVTLDNPTHQVTVITATDGN